MNSTAVVVAGGIGGLATTIGLHRIRWNVTVIERSRPPKTPELTPSCAATRMILRHHTWVPPRLAQYFGPMWASMRATESFRATETLNGSLPRARTVHRTPTLVSVSVQSFRMSSDLLVKKYRGYS